MKITNSTNTAITGVSPKLVETGNGFLINTQYYTKERLSAVALEFIRTSGSPYTVNTRKQLFLQNTTWRLPHDEVGIYKDSYYPNRYYVRVAGGFVESTSITTYLVTLEEIYNGELKCLNITTFNDMTLTDILDQDENFLYLQIRNSAATNIYTFNKSTFANANKSSTASQSRNYAYMTKVYRDESNIYLMHMSDQNIYSVIFNKSTQTATTSLPIYRGQEITGAASLFTVLSDHPYHINENTSGVYYFNTSDPVQPIDLYCQDRSLDLANGFTMKPVNIVWNDKIKNQFDFAVGAVGNTIRMFISEFDDVKYLNVVSYQMNFSNTATYIQNQGIYTFRIDSDEQLTLVSFNPIDRTKLIGGFIYDESKEHLIVSKLNAFQILKFNKETLMYETTSLEVPACYSVGLDELQRIWYIKTDSSTHMINMQDAQSVNIKFEKPYYDYAGASIDTYVTFSAIDYLGDPFAGTFELSIDGPAVFTEDGNTSITFNYNGEGEQQINITILGASPITIYPKFIKII